MFFLKSRKTKDISISGFHKWAIYLIGLLETLIFSACVFGWAQLVYVLKNEEIFLNLCQSENLEMVSNDQNISNVSTAFINDTIKMRGCPEQDQMFALVFTIANVALNLIGAFSGLSLYYFGLFVTRMYSTTSLILGFLALGLTDKEHPYWLYISMFLIPIGGSSLRISGLQFCNLFDKWKSTALTIISGSYSASSGIFLLFQIGQQYGLSLWKMSFIMSLFATMSLMASIFMPWHHIQYDTEELKTKRKLPFRNSVLSISFFTNSFCFLYLMTCVRFYVQFFNAWTTQIASTNNEVAFYSLLYSVGSFVSLIFTPWPGIFNDILIQKIKSTNPNKKESFVKELKVPIYTLTILLLLKMAMYVCLLFNHQLSIYISIVLVQMIRPWMFSVLNAFLRMRFPQEHFDRLNGLNTFLRFVTSPFQYFLFLWIQDNKNQAITVILTLSLTTFIHPFHLLSKKYRKKIANERLQDTEKDEEGNQFLQNENQIQLERVQLNDQ